MKAEIVEDGRLIPTYIWSYLIIHVPSILSVTLQKGHTAFGKINFGEEPAIAQHKAVQYSSFPNRYIHSIHFPQPIVYYVYV